MKFAYHKLVTTTVMTIFAVTSLTAQSSDGKLSHLKVKRLNDSYIDVYHNTPTENRKFPLLVFCQGSGYDSNTEGFLQLLQQFEKDIVGLAIEKEGVRFGDKGDTLSEAYKRNNTIYNRLYDYLRVFQYLRLNANWWNGDIYLIGGSEGGLLAGMLACYYPDVKAVALFSFGGGLSFGEAWPISSGLQKKVMGASKYEIEDEINRVKDSLSTIRTQPTYLKSYSGDDNTYAWWVSIIDLRLENCLIDLEIPIFLAQGSEDLMAPPISAQTLNEHFIEAGKKNLTYREYKGYDHEYKDTNDKSHLVEVIMEGIQWMLNVK